jgi:hypothetical protein
MVSPDTLDRMLDHPLEHFFVLVPLGYQVPDVDEHVLGLIIGYLGHESSGKSILEKYLGGENTHSRGSKDPWISPMKIRR